VEGRAELGFVPALLLPEIPLKDSSGGLRSRPEEEFFPEVGMLSELVLQPFRHQNVVTPKVEDAPSEVSWTETLLEVEEASLIPEKLEGGKTSYSIRLVFAADPESRNNQRNRTEMQLAFGLEEKDVPTFTRLLERKVLLTQQRPIVSLEREQLEKQLLTSREYITQLEAKVEYLNNSLHQYIQESRNSNF
jgi:hypothetical protein